MARSSCALQPGVALQEKVEGHWMNNSSVHDETSRQVTATVRIAGLIGEEASVMTFAADDQRELRLVILIDASAGVADGLSLSIKHGSVLSLRDAATEYE